MFRCKACQAKDAHIASLKAQIEDLRAFTVPKNDPFSIPVISVEADAVLSGKDHLITVAASDTSDPKTVEIQSEASLILSGNY